MSEHFLTYYFMILDVPRFQFLVNIEEIDYYMEKIRKTTRKQLGLEDKRTYFQWIASLISSNGEDNVWVPGGLGVVS